MTWLDFIALVLATGAPINAWLRDQGLFRGPREWLIAWGEVDEPEDASETWRPSWGERCKALVAELVQCSFCLHYHLPFWLLGCWAVGLFLPPPWGMIVKLPIYSLAATRLSYWLSRLAREREEDR